MKNQSSQTLVRRLAGAAFMGILSFSSNAQTNVFDDVIAASPNHTHLEAALIAAGLDDDLQNNAATLTVFAPDDNAFNDLASQLGVTVNDLLNLPDLADILTYHVLGTTVNAAGVTNGAIVTPLFTGNTLKLTKTASNNVYVNHAMVTAADLTAANGVVHSIDAVLMSSETVIDVALDNGFTTLVAAVVQEELVPVLSDPFAQYTVFAPSNTAFDDLAASLNTNIAGLLALPNLDDVLKYHVLGTEVVASAVTNGAVVNPLSTTNSLKLTKTSANAVFVNHASVVTADVQADNGVVHVIDKVVLPVNTVVDVALDNGFTTLATAVIQEELIPALSDPFAQYTVFAPNNAAFDSLAADLNTNIAGLLALPNLDDVLKYHVLGTEVVASAVTNGAVVNPLSTTNSLKLTKTAANAVFVNHASVLTADVQADNGVVHVIDKVVLPVNTVVDVAIDNNFSTLVSAVVKAELVPALSDPFQEFTVFAPTNTAFDNLATTLGTDLNGILNLPNLADILTYHVVSGNVNAADLMNGPVATLNGANIIVNLSNGVKINDATVTMADVEADNGVVHVLDKVILESFLGLDNNEILQAEVYPNPATDKLTISGVNNGEYILLNNLGQKVKSGAIPEGDISIDGLSEGSYLLQLNDGKKTYVTRVIKK
ncbi:fasciclin domain-containing protein [uncultured Fluviicola sp.]|uniref:fasciclin domain-containing protein n=1 Tax=uncultured Fluviicola sp. TaxID=463303 RepID=UPI0025D87DB2|nr:fasciclin domain-containing protein [uncultured Fluviicola sp.]